MDTYKHRYLDLKTRWKEYYELQVQLWKKRGVIYITSCLGFLLIQFIVGMLVFSRQGVIVRAEVSDSQPAPQTMIQARYFLW